VIGDHADAMPIAQGEGGTENPIDLREHRRLRVIGAQVATSAEQMRQTGLMRGRAKASIRRPAVPHEHAREVAAEHGRRLRKAAARLNAIHRDAVGGEGPQPRQHAGHLPAGFIRLTMGLPRTCAHSAA
jgi:hypothetical protein